MVAVHGNWPGQQLNSAQWSRECGQGMQARDVGRGCKQGMQARDADRQEASSSEQLLFIWERKSSSSGRAL